MNTFIDDNEYSNFSLRDMMETAIKRKKDLASGKLRSDLDTSRAELQTTKSELDKTKKDIEELKSVSNKAIEQKQDINQPLPLTSKSKLPLIIGGVVVLGIGIFVLIKKLR
jgi:uncharacterized membrane protein YukC